MSYNIYINISISNLMSIKLEYESTGWCCCDETRNVEITTTTVYANYAERICAVEKKGNCYLIWTDHLRRIPPTIRIHIISSTMAFIEFNVLSLLSPLCYFGLPISRTSYYFGWLSSANKIKTLIKQLDDMVYLYSHQY